MSGGSWDYSYQRIEDDAERLQQSADARRVALGQLMEKVAKAMHDIEWVDSNDYGKGAEFAAIDAVVSRDEVLQAARDRLGEEITRARITLADFPPQGTIHAGVYVRSESPPEGS